jgi:hypothetical protein
MRDAEAMIRDDASDAKMRQRFRGQTLTGDGDAKTQTLISKTPARC